MMEVRSSASVKRNDLILMWVGTIRSPRIIWVVEGWQGGSCLAMMMTGDTSMLSGPGSIGRSTIRGELRSSTITTYSPDTSWPRGCPVHDMTGRRRAAHHRMKISDIFALPSTLPNTSDSHWRTVHPFHVTSRWMRRLGEGAAVI